jgi:hypothetical protein
MKKAIQWLVQFGDEDRTKIWLDERFVRDPAGGQVCIGRTVEAQWFSDQDDQGPYPAIVLDKRSIIIRD